MPDAVKDTAGKYTKDKGQGHKRYTTIYFSIVIIN